MNELLIEIFQKLIKINEYLSRTSNDENFRRTNEFRIRSLKTGLRIIKNFQSKRNSKFKKFSRFSKSTKLVRR